MFKTFAGASSAFAYAADRTRRRPRLRDWGEAAVLLGGFLVLAAAIAAPAGLITIDGGVDLAWPEFILVVLIALFIPALAEEFIFRGLLHRALGGPASLVLFIVWHPLQVWLDLPMAQPVFLNWAFLLIAGGLGLACTISVRRSGSIWCAVAIHWAVVVGWKALAG